MSNHIFNSYQFELQQFATNSRQLQDEINTEHHQEEQNKLLGMNWNTNNDRMYTPEHNLNTQARTLREILSSINSCYDPLNISLPCRNRAKLFLRKIQNEQNTSWDLELSECHIKEWIKITKQFNLHPSFSIPRYIGDYKDEYELICYTDASKELFGCVIYLKEVNSFNMSFLTAKNKVVSKGGLQRTIPVLE